MRFKATFIAGALLAAMATAGQATVLPYKSFDRLVSESEGIVVGTVRSVETAAVGQASELHTFVTIDQVEALSGKVAEGRLTLRMKGGFDGRQGLHVEGAPQFKAGERVLLFVQGNGRDLVPFVGWTQGVFRLVDDGAGHQVVRDADGNVVTGVEGGNVMRRAGEHLETAVVGAPSVVQQRSATPRASAGRTENGSAVQELAVQAAAQPPMTADRFMAEVRKRAGASAGSPLRSVTPADGVLMTAAPVRDMAAAASTAATQPVAQPTGNSVMLPMQRKSNPAADQR